MAVGICPLGAQESGSVGIVDSTDKDTKENAVVSLTESSPKPPLLASRAGCRYHRLTSSNPGSGKQRPTAGRSEGASDWIKTPWGT